MDYHGRVSLLSTPLFPYFSSIIRYEFAPNEFVTALECVTLETLSTESGSKEFIAVGTTINRGEDLAVKGAVSARITL
jgi:cleavage and polyadenylation specificity factor subunit 1